MKVYYYSACSANGRSCANKFTQFECLNELKDTSSRSIENVIQMNKFVFECDNVDKEKQLERAMNLFNEGIVQRVTDSGNKSIHVIIQVKQCEKMMDVEKYKIIWNYLNKKYFNNEADRACSNPNRLTRTPNALRSSNSKCQYCYAENSNNILELSKDDIVNIISDYKRQKMLQNLQLKSFGSPNDGMCANYDRITRYLNTPFPNITGNGVSSKWLFCAIKTCQQYNDNATLERVLSKARSEKWTEKELSRVLASKPR